MNDSICNKCGVTYTPSTSADLPPRLREAFDAAARLGGRDPAEIRDPGTCPRCTHDAQRAAMVAEAKAAAEKRKREEIREILTIVPKHFRAVAAEGFGSLVQDRVASAAAVDAARDAIGAPMVLLAGEAGSGKTTLAAAMMGAIVQRALDGDAAAVRLARGAVWVEAAELARARAAHRLGDGEAPAVREAMGATILFVDDLGAERGGDRDGAIADVLWARHAAERPCVWTTGISGAVIEERYGSGFKRRLAERGHAVVIRCDAARKAA